MSHCPNRPSNGHSELPFVGSQFLSLSNDILPFSVYGYMYQHLGPNIRGKKVEDLGDTTGCFDLCAVGIFGCLYNYKYYKYLNKILDNLENRRRSSYSIG